MATTLDVYPGTGTIPTTGEVLRLGLRKFHSHLNRLKIDLKPEVQVQAITAQDSRLVDPQEPLLWPRHPHTYLWFTVKGVNGGTDASWHQLRTEPGWEAPGYGLPFFPYQFDAPQVYGAARIFGHFWSFHRSAGQPASIVALYGCLASALAELTDGAIYSDDGAWDFTLFPCDSAQFDAAFLRADQTTDEERQRLCWWAEYALYEELLWPDDPTTP